MRNILIITAHPTSHNLTTGIAEIYKTEKEKQGHSVEIIDLYRDKQQPFFAFEKVFEKTLTDEQIYYQEMITKAEEIVFVYPFFGGIDTSEKKVNAIFDSVKKIANN